MMTVCNELNKMEKGRVRGIKLNLVLLLVQCGAKRTHVFQIIVALFIFNIKKLCQHQNNL
jgi:hypothetical protein